MRWADKDLGKEHKEGIEAEEFTDTDSWTFSAPSFLPFFLYIPNHPFSSFNLEKFSRR